MRDMSIRTGTPADHDAVSGIYRRSSLFNEGDRDNLLAHPEALHYAGTALGDGRTRVALFDGRIIGFATTRPVQAWLELDDLFVDPEWMRKGVARALVRDAAESATKVRITRIDVTANEHALPFYESVGFLVDALVETPFGISPHMHLDIG